MRKTAIFLAVGVAAILSVAVTTIGLNNIAFADPPGEDGKKGGPNLTTDSANKNSTITSVKSSIRAAINS
jgi:hypothetical protein